MRAAAVTTAHSSHLEMSSSGGGNGAAVAAAVAAAPPVQRERDDVAAITVASLFTRQTRLEARFAACGVIFFVFNTGLLFLIIANYLIVAGSFVYTQNQLK
jgi:hypothetical protein